MIGFLLAMMLAADTPAATDATDATAEPWHWGEFSRSEARRRNSVHVLIGNLDYDRVAHKTAVWMRRDQRDAQGKSRVDWADSRSCPAILEALLGMRALPRPEFQPPGIDDGDLTIIMDGVGYSLTAPAGYNGVLGLPLTITSNVQTPLAKWIDDSLAALEPCWSEKAPLAVAR